MHMKYGEILVCVAGATPQIITETIYALSTKDPPILLDEIFIITTKKGKDIIKDVLIEKGILNQLTEDYNIPPLKISDRSIITIKNGDKEIDDIRNTEESEAAANTIIDFIRDITIKPNTRLHCSIAGGRKTMSFYLGTALQLFGRPQDRLYHVLVSPEFESNQEFFYPPKIPKKVKCRLENGSFKNISTAEARIELAELPFLRLRDKIELKEKTFKELMNKSQNEIDMAIIQPEITVNLKKREIKIASIALTLPPVMLAIYSFFLQRKKNCEITNSCLLCHKCYVSINQLTEEPFIKELALIYGTIYEEDSLKVREFIKNYSKKYVAENLRSYISKINMKILQTVSDESVYQCCIINSIRKYGSTIYGIPIDRRKIKIN